MTNNRNTGPTTLPNEVLEAMAHQPISHRSSDFSESFFNVTINLSNLVNAPLPALLLTCSGTGGLEASISTLVNENSRVLVISAGTYGDLLARIASCFTTYLDVIRFDSGSSFDLIYLDEQLLLKNYDVVLLTHSESSTGVYHPISNTIQTIRVRSEALILVDVISSIGATPIDMSKWGADVLVGATQKALMAPAGMAIVFLSHKAKSYIETQPAKFKYMHLRPWLEASKSKTVPYTPSIHVFQGLRTALKLIFNEGLDVRYRRHREAASRCRAFFSENEHIAYFAPIEYESHSITALCLSNSLSASKIKNRLQLEHEVIVSNGLGTLSERLIRIGHMGHFTLYDVDNALNAIEQVVQSEVDRNGS